MEQEVPIFGALIEVVPEPGNDIFDGDPGAFTNFWARAADDAEFRKLAESAFATKGLRIAAVEDLMTVHADADQPVQAREALARIAAGAPWAHSTFHVYPESD